VIRLALAAIIFCSTLCAALGTSPSGSPGERETPHAATRAQALLDCAPSDDDGEWRPQHDATAFLPESSWKWRTLHLGVAAARPTVFVANALADPPAARANAAPSYLLHTPLLI
jgi:hypothetical protein